MGNVLRRDILVLADQNRLRFYDGQTCIDVNIGRSTLAMGSWYPDLDGLASDLDENDHLQLCASLKDAQFLLEHARLENGLGPSSISLADAITRFRSGHSAERCFVVTSHEGLWLASDPVLNKLALRLFISRMDDKIRLAAYAGLASGTSLRMFGDLPSGDTIEGARKILQGFEYPVTADLGLNAVTGELRNIQAAAADHAGRLGIVQLTHTSQWQFPKHQSHFYVNGTSAHPNLRALDPFNLDQHWTLGVSGASTRASEAAAKCRSEGIERFVTGDISQHELKSSPASKLGGPWLDPRAIISYSPMHRQRAGLQEFDPEKVDWWVRGSRGQSPAWLPAALVFSPFLNWPSWLEPGAVSSNGVAAHPDQATAVESAWLECVERDAFQRARISAHQSGALNITASATVNGPAEAIVQQMKEQAQVLILLLASPTGIPVILVRADTDDGVALGMSANNDVGSATLKAATEAYAQMVRPFTHDVTVTKVNTPGDHAALYRQESWKRKLDWMHQVPEAALPSSQRGKPLPTRIYTYHFPSPLSLDRHVVRVIDPSLIPLTFGYDSDPTGRQDFQNLCQANRISLNYPLEPHPFA